MGEEIILDTRLSLNFHAKTLLMTFRGHNVRCGGLAHRFLDGSENLKGPEGAPRADQADL